MTAFKTAAACTMLLAVALSGCGTSSISPAGVARHQAGAPIAAAATGQAAAFEKALTETYGALFTPAGAKVKATKVEVYSLGGGTKRIRGIIVVETKDFTAQLEAMAALKGDKIVADYFPAFGSVTADNKNANVIAAAEYAVRIQRIDRQQLDRKAKLGTCVDPQTYTVKTNLFGAKESSLAEVSYQSEGFLGKGSTFTEYYRINGKRGAKVVIDDVTYNDNKATDPNGNDLDG